MKTAVFWVEMEGKRKKKVQFWKPFNSGKKENEINRLFKNGV